MAEIVYCDRCGHRIPQADIDSGRAVITPSDATCAACAESLPGKAPAPLRMAAPPPGQRPSARRAGMPRTPSDSQARRKSTRATARDAYTPEEKKGLGGLAIAGAGAGVLVGVAAAVLFLGGSGDERPAPPRPGPMKPAVAPPSRVAVPPPVAPPRRAAPASPKTTAGARLREIASWRDPFFGRYADIRKALEAFPREFPGAPELAEAKELLAEVDEAHAKLAFRVYWDACESAYSLAAKGKYDEAAAALRAVSVRFGETPWHRDAGEARITAMLAKLKETRGEAARKGIARARDEIDAKSFAAAREALAARAGWPEAERAKAEALAKRIDELEAEAKAGRTREIRWRAFLVKLHEAGKKGVAEAAALVEGEREGLAAAGLDKEMALVGKRVGDAKRVEEYAAIGFSASRRQVRLTWKGQRVAGKILEVEGGIIKLRTSLRKELDIPIAELDPEDIARAVGKSLKPVDLAAYFMTRGDLGSARGKVDGLGGDKVSALLDAADEIEKALEASRAAAAAAPAGPAAPAPSATTAVVAPPRPVPVARADLPRVENGSMTEGDKTPTGWGGTWKKNGRVEVARDTTTFAKGPASLRLDTFGADVAGQASGIVVNGKGTFTVNGSFKCEGAGIKMCMVAVQAFDAAWKQLYWVHCAEALKASDWAEFSKEVTVPEGAARAQVVLFLNGEGKAWLDEVEIVPSQAALAAGGQHVPGLLGEYFTGTDLNPANLKVTRVEPQLDFDWGTGTPANEVGIDEFSCRWTGELNVPADGRYRFRMKRDNGARLVVDGRTVIDAWNPGTGEESGETDLKKGWVPIRVELYEGGGDAVLRLSWSGQGGGMQIVSTDHLRTPAPGSAVAATGSPPAEGLPEVSQEDLPKGPNEPLPGETGKPGQWAPGLICEIFKGADFKKRVGVRIDPLIGYEYGEAGPDLGVGATEYSIRWTGWLLVPSTGEYAFEAWGDDVFDIVLDGKPLFRAGAGNDGKTPPRVCEAGLHPIKVTLVQHGGWAKAHLRWKRPGSNSFGTIPGGYFYHEVPELGSMGPFAKLCQGVFAEYYAGENFERKVGHAVLEKFNFDIGAAPIFIRGNAQLKDNFSVRMTSYLFADNRKNFKFEIDMDDGARVFIDGDRVASHWDLSTPDKLGFEKTVDAGYHKMVVEYLEKSRDSKLILRYDNGGMKDLPGELLFREARAGRGAAGKTLTLDRRRLAPGIDGLMYPSEKPRASPPALKTFQPCAGEWWGKSSPGPGLGADRFSGEWNGVLLVPSSGQYFFRVWQQCGVKLLVGGQPVINRWSATDGWVDGRAMLRAGPVPFNLSFFERRGNTDSAVWVHWVGPGVGYQFISTQFVAHPARRLPIAKAWEEATPPKVAAGGTPRPGGPAPAAPRVPAAPGPGGAAEPMPGGNLVTNGGFEDVGGDRFATGWHKWIDGGAQASVRTDMADAHGGEKSLSVKAFADGVRAGAWSTLAKTMPPGKYEIRFWACAEANARVGVTVAGRELEDAPVGEDWAQIRKEFQLTEKQARPSLRIYVATPKVKVWIDDVEVGAAK